MEKGDKVRFLNAIGGGEVKGFQAGGMVLVEDEDGFESPYPEKELVIVPKVELPKAKTQKTKVKPSFEAKKEEEEEAKEEETEEAEPNLIIETKDGNRLSVIIAFAAQDLKQLQTTPYDAYLINDSNYFLSYNIATIDGKEAISEAHGTIEPNMKYLFCTLSKDDLNKWMRMKVQLLAYKQKSYEPKPMVDEEIKISPVKFYKLHSFVENEYLDDKAILITIIKDDAVIIGQEEEIDGEQLRRAMMQKIKIDTPNIDKKKKENSTEKEADKRKNDVIEVDLHINELIDSTTGMSAADILQYQRDKFNEVMIQYQNKRGQKIVFIHGKGDGVLRKELLKELKHKYPNCYVQDASFKEYGFGATQVIIK